MDIKTLFDEKKEQLYFIELNKDITLGGKVFKKGLDLPVDKDVLQNTVAKSDDFDFKKILRDMCLLIGLDATFVHRDVYIDIAKHLLKNPYEYCMHLGVVSSQKNRPVDALCFFKAGLAFNETAIDSYYNMGKVYYSLATQQEPVQGAMALSESAFKKAREIENKPEIDYYMAYVAYSGERYSEAFDYAKKALSANLPEEYSADLIEKMPLFEDKTKYQLGYQYVLDGRYQEALEALLTISVAHEDDWRVQFFIGLAFRGEQRYQDAIMRFKKARDLNMAEDRIYNELGITYMLMAEFNSAKEVFMEGLSLKPLNAEMLCNLAIVHLELDEKKLAKKFIEEAYKIAPDDQIINDTSAYIDKLMDESTDEDSKTNS